MMSDLKEDSIKQINQDLDKKASNMEKKFRKEVEI
jgi:hypothetical protein